MGRDKIKEVNNDKLRRDFGELQFKLGECDEDFARSVTALVNQLSALGDKAT
jgi:hypothetical protein